MSRRTRTIVGAAVAGGALLYLVAAGIGGNLVYFLTPTELIAKGQMAYGVSFRLSGEVVPGSVRWNAEAVDLRFRIRDEQNTIEVVSTGVPPQMFQDGMEVIVEGSLDSTGVFQSTNLMVKHSNEYGPGEGEEHPEKAYEGLLTKGDTT
ncbi:MAG: cytochrome c maturation protein CcmE [Gemmatimonadota bacterium]|nr:MAG: cytochrome c maturation protein CcmE [Gemmatimonadota bacterium]